MAAEKSSMKERKGNPCPYDKQPCPLSKEGCAAWGGFRTRPGTPLMQGCIVLQLPAAEIIAGGKK